MAKTFPALSIKTYQLASGWWQVEEYHKGRLAFWCSYATIEEAVASISRVLNGSLSMD